jgi:hypothetical protein
VSGPGEVSGDGSRRQEPGGEVIQLSTRRTPPGSRRAENQGADDHEPDRRASTLALIVAIVIVVVGYILIKELADNTKIDDCNLAGRKNCVPIDVPASRSSLPTAMG